jgi:hypothetical protein
VLERRDVQLVLQVLTPVLVPQVALLVLLGDTALQTIAEAALRVLLENTKQVEDRERAIIALLGNINRILPMEVALLVGREHTLPALHPDALRVPLERSNPQVGKLYAVTVQQARIALFRVEHFVLLFLPAIIRALQVLLHLFRVLLDLAALQGVLLPLAVEQVHTPRRFLAPVPHVLQASIPDCDMVHVHSVLQEAFPALDP